MYIFHTFPLLIKNQPKPCPLLLPTNNQRTFCIYPSARFFSGATGFQCRGKRKTNYLNKQAKRKIFLFDGISYNCRIMEANTNLLQRHFVAKEALKKAAQPYIDNNTLREKSREIADTLGVSFQTVLNYAYGMTNDGFLTEAITKELKKYKK